MVKTKADEGEEAVQGGKSLFLRGWLTEAETAEVSTVFHLCALAIECWRHPGFLTFIIPKVLALCEEDDVTLHGLVLAAGLTAVARFESLLLFQVSPQLSSSLDCAMGAVPLPQRQPHCELVSPPTFVNIAVQLLGMVCTQKWISFKVLRIKISSYKAFTRRPMKRRTAFHPLLMQRTCGVWHISFPCRLGLGLNCPL